MKKSEAIKLTIECERYSVDSQPVCGIDFATEPPKVCKFLGTVNFGTRYVCCFDTFNRRSISEGSNGFLVPHKDCQIWKKR